MTKIALIADVHVANHKRWGGPLVGGVNQRGWECIDVLKRASELARSQGCAGLFVLGDLFDHTKPTPALVAATVNALKWSGVPVHIILGNHDRQSMHELDQACASMGLVQGIEVYSEPTLWGMHMGLEVAMIPYRAEEAKDWLTAGLASLQWTPATATRVVLTHCGIWDDETPAYLKQGKDTVGVGHVRWLCDAHSINFFAAGNWHDAKAWQPRPGTKDPRVLIPGTACPHNFSDPQEHGRMVIFDAKDNSYNSISLPTPLFLKSELGPRAQAIPGEIKNHYRAPSAPRVYLRLDVRHDEVSTAMELRELIVKAHPNAIVHIEVRPDEAKLAAREAARAAVRAGESEQSLIDYAEIAEVQEPGTMDGVVRRLSEYRKAAG